ncbi:MAG: hypothetical protein OHK0022_25840 [Roseiflexaceae bacterium]
MNRILILSAPAADTAPLAQMLEAQSYHVKTVAAPKQSNGHAPNLVVVDGRAPHAEDAVDLLGELRDDEQLGLLPVLLLASATPDPEVAAAADLVLIEPCEAEALGTACRTLGQMAPTLATLRRELRGCERRVARLQEIDQQKDEFISLMSHELKNPMASIKGYADLMRRRASKNPDDPNQKGLEVISQQIGRMTGLLDQLLDFSRISMDRLQLARRRNDLAALVERTVEQARQTTDTPIQLYMEEPDLPADLDDTRMGQVLAGVLNNAIKFSPAGGEISVRVMRVMEDDGDRALISVRDRGIGIPPGELRQVFEQFYRASNASSVAGGMGLGLFVAHDIIERHGGSIQIDSDLGRGTLVIIALPLVTEEERVRG